MKKFWLFAPVFLLIFLSNGHAYANQSDQSILSLLPLDLGNIQKDSRNSGETESSVVGKGSLSKLLVEPLLKTTESVFSSETETDQSDLGQQGGESELLEQTGELNGSSNQVISSTVEMVKGTTVGLTNSVRDLKDDLNGLSQSLVSPEKGPVGGTLSSVKEISNEVADTTEFVLNESLLETTKKLVDQEKGVVGETLTAVREISNEVVGTTEQLLEALLLQDNLEGVTPDRVFGSSSEGSSREGSLIDLIELGLGHSDFRKDQRAEDFLEEYPIDIIPFPPFLPVPPENGQVPPLLKSPEKMNKPKSATKRPKISLRKKGESVKVSPGEESSHQDHVPGQGANTDYDAVLVPSSSPRVGIPTGPTQMGGGNSSFDNTVLGILDDLAIQRNTHFERYIDRSFILRDQLAHAPPDPPPDCSFFSIQTMIYSKNE